jgi:glycosyltransferase involved in cell wall biosynthesis
LSKALLIAEAANPEWASVPLIGWSLARAISTRVPSHLVTQVRNRDALLRAGLREGRDFTAIDNEKVARPLWRIAQVLRGAPGVGWTTVSAVTTISYYYFEWLVWKQFEARLRAGEFDVVHRITPLSPTTPSILARQCARYSIPFVLGPLNGGVPWPKEFSEARIQEREWLSYVRDAYKLLPGYRSTLANSAALIVGSRWTLAAIPEKYRDKCIYIPENAVDPEEFAGAAPAPASGPLKACFVGRLVPYKGPDMLVEAVAPLVAAGRLHLDIIGDGPLMPKIAEFVRANNLQSGISLHGWIKHREVPALMSNARLLLFPSIREFGGGVILEAMALGIVPVVVDYAGPGELVTPSCGFKIPLGTRASLIERLRRIVSGICDDPKQLEQMAAACQSRVSSLFTWGAKANQVLEIYHWARRQAAVPSSEGMQLPQELDYEGARFG